MKTQVKFRETVGKTIERIGGSECGEMLIILFTDGTFAALRPENDILIDFEISLKPHPDYGSSRLWWPAKLIELGIVTKEEVEESDRLVKVAEAKRQKTEELATLKRLLSKYKVK